MLPCSASMIHDERKHERSKNLKVVKVLDKSQARELKIKKRRGRSKRRGGGGGDSSFRSRGEQSFHGDFRGGRVGKKQHSKDRMFIAPPSSNFLSVAARFHLLCLNIRCAQLMGERIFMIEESSCVSIKLACESVTRCLLRVLKKENSKLLTASAVFLPVHPMMDSVIQTRMMELTREPEAPDRAVAQWHLWKSVVAEWCAAFKEKIGRSRCRQWWNDATKEGSTQTSFWWFEVTPSKHQNEFPSVPPVNSAYSIQSDAVENESYQSSLKYPSRQPLFYNTALWICTHHHIVRNSSFGSFHIFVIRGLARDSEIQEGSVLEAEVEMFKKLVITISFKNCLKIKQKTLVNMAVDSGCYIYQSPSLNILMDYPNYKKMTSLQFHDWPKEFRYQVHIFVCTSVVSNR
ncbi:hypothetical protein AHAS_Ahas16G0055200 [Arachis hypogaea]